MWWTYAEERQFAHLRLHVEAVLEQHEPASAQQDTRRPHMHLLSAPNAQFHNAQNARNAQNAQMHKNAKTKCSKMLKKTCSKILKDAQK